ncbi:MAG: OmpA family protein [Bacteroidota bacterium]|nr:OmpA family protein [Bacteroidota bacterium]
MKNQNIYFSFILIAASLFTAGCVSNGKYAASQQALHSARNDSAQLANKVTSLENSVSQMKTQIGSLNAQVSDLAFKAGQFSTDAADKASQLSQSKEQLAAEQARLIQLQALMDQQKKSIEDIRKKMSEALVGFTSKELTVSIKNGKVYVSLQENLLFPSGSASVNPNGIQALGKLAAVLNVNTDITVNIEGHTDSIPIRSNLYPDNWALSTARAVSIVRVLIKNYQVDPIRLTASGQSQYDPVESNSTPQGRAQNRRTDIILSPNLNELYKLLGAE